MPNGASPRRGNREARTGPYGTVYDPWANEWARARLSTTQLLVMIKLCERLEFDADGTAKAWYPRAEMARELERSEETVKQAVRGLIREGFLKVRTRGYRGRSTVYEIMPGVRWPQIGGASKYPNREKGVSTPYAKGVHPDTPLISKEGAPAHSGSPTRIRSEGGELLREAFYGKEGKNGL